MRSKKTHFKLQAEEDRSALSVIGCVQWPLRKLEFSISHAGTKLCQVKAHLYRTLTVLPTAQKKVTRVAHVKATKHKANLATDEVRVENRNYVLALSESGNNRTVARLLS